MKKLIWLPLVFLLLIVAACKKDDPTDPNNNPTPPETSITFTCKDTVGIRDILVGIAPLSADRDSGIFLRNGTTDGFGKIKFNNLAPQKFYYSCVRSIVGGIVTRKGDVTVLQDEKKFVTVNF